MTIYSLVYCKLGKYSFPNLEPVHCSMSGSRCCFLTCIQVSQEASKVVWNSHFCKNPIFYYCHVAEKHKWPSPLPRISRLFSEDHFVFLLLRSWLLLLGNWKMPTSSRWYLHTENGPWFHWASDLDFKGRSFIHFASRGNAYSWVVLFASALYFCTLPLF